MTDPKDLDAIIDDLSDQYSDIDPDDLGIMLQGVVDAHTN